MDNSSIKSITAKNLKIQAYYAKEYRDYDMHLHTHSYLEIMYINEGRADIGLLIDGKEISVPVNRQQFIIIDFNVFHKLTVPQYCNLMNIEFKPISISGDCCPTFDALARSSRPLANLLSKFDRYQVFEDISNVAKYIQELHRETLKVNGTDQLLATQYLTDLLFLNIAKCCDVPLYSSGIRHFNRAIAYITRNVDSQIKIVDIADYVGINESYLQRIFKQQTGDTIINYINKEKVARAKHMILTTDYPFVELGAMLGFNSRQNFYYVFRTFTGLSPQEYKRKYKRKNYTIINGLYEHMFRPNKP